MTNQRKESSHPMQHSTGSNAAVELMPGRGRDEHGLQNGVWHGSPVPDISKRRQTTVRRFRSPWLQPPRGRPPEGAGADSMGNGSGAACAGAGQFSL